MEQEANREPAPDEEEPADPKTVVTMQQHETNNGDVKPVGKTADRPHWITIALALLSPVATVAAIIIAAFSFGVSRQSLEITQKNMEVAQQALKVSEQNMKVAQRAYVSITDGAIHLAVQFNKKQVRASTARATISFRVHNLGNTPAEIEFIRINVSPGDPYVMASPENLNGLFLVGPETTIGPKASITQRHTLEFTTDKTTIDYLEYEKREAITAALFTRNISFTVDVVYKDVFGESFSASACTEAAPGAKIMIDCTPDRFK